MEPVTQALLGAATGQLVAGRRIGRQAMLFGALVAMSPDLDVVLGPLHGGFGEWLYHRGTTHSLWFGFAAGPLLGWFLWRWRDPNRVTPLSAWIAMAVVALVTHPILDGFTPYGTQFFAPFSRARFAWNGVGIVDPMYTLLLGAGVVYAASAGSKRRSLARANVALALGLGLSSLYLAMGLWINHRVVGELHQIFERELGPVSRARAYPTLLQPWLRHFVVHVGDRRAVGFHSLMASGCPSWRVHRMPAPNARIDATLGSWQGELLDWFADGDIGIEERRVPFGSTVRIEDLRYAWSNAEARGMWGIEARFDRDGQLTGPIRRFGRAGPQDRDLGLLMRAMRGDLPGSADGWMRPVGCESGAAQQADTLTARAAGGGR